MIGRDVNDQSLFFPYFDVDYVNAFVCVCDFLVFVDMELLTFCVFLDVVILHRLELSF